MIRKILPILGFAAGLTAFQWVATGRVTWYPLATLVVYFGARVVVWLLPLRLFRRAVNPRSRTFPIVLFFLFLRHFTRVAADEARRTFQARAFAVAQPYGPMSFRSLMWALVALFRRSLRRAERFYAACLVSGMAE